MATKLLSAAVQHIHNMVTDPSQSKDDGQLLAAFLANNDQVAFTTIIRRHGPMVLGICQRFLNDYHAAEDAFQATFILLAQQAGCIRKKESLASWLHGVGFRMARETKRAAIRRRRNERQSGRTMPSADPAHRAAWLEIQTILDEEIQALPSPYREPFVRCCLEQISCSEVASQLGLEEATVRKRLMRARKRLQSQLNRRGVSLSAVLAGLAVLGTGTPTLLASSLVCSVARLAVHAAEGHSLATVVPQHIFSLIQGANKVMFLTKMKMAAFLFVTLATVGGAFGLNALQMAGATSPQQKNSGVDETPTLVGVDGDSILLSANTSAKLGIRVGEVKQRTAAKQRVLELAGSTALMPSKIARITGGFAPFEVIEIGKFEGVENEARQLRVGDKVAKGQVLATITSAEIGKKKNELFDAAVQLKLDQMILERAGQAAGAVTEVFLLNAKRNALTDLSAVTRAQDNLKTWGIPDDEIETVRKQAREVAENPKLDTEEQRKTRLKEWSKTALRSPIDGIIVERNLNTGEVVTDGKTNLFQIANVDQLLIIANVRGDDLPNLESLQAAERRWSIKAAGASRPIEGMIDEFSYLGNSKEYAAIAKGYVDNKDHRVRAGQYITASITLPLATNEMVLSTAALVEEKGQTFVFVQTDAKKPVYEQRRIVIVRRGLDVVHIRIKLTPEEEKQGFQTIWVGERVVTAGAIELKAIFDDLKGR
ncbi:MAG TPA: sigma-70 family RNA polymerase sigma factor [Gemmata sp.]|jgi:cobalt-zinc-cadmium efflux system membrane fusion protein|nr:sigma-70 family RNA polymerase sigma factor [Gemmata sp.]